MAAYHSSLWARFYDTWVNTLFDPNEPSIDAPVFLDQLLQVEAELDNASRSKATRILEVGTGSGRLVRELFKELTVRTSLQGNYGYVLIGTEPSVAMLAKAKSLWRSLTEESGVTSEKVKVFWEQASSGDFGDCAARILDATREGVAGNDVLFEEPYSTGRLDLIIFAAGGVSHVASLEDVKAFMSQVSKTLNQYGGRAIVSVLREFFSPGNHVELDPKLAQWLASGKADRRIKPPYETPLRLPDPGLRGKVFVKYPTTELWDSAQLVRTDSFRLAVENEDGSEEASEELGWQMKVVNLDEWKILLDEAALRLRDIVASDMQVWLVIEKR